MATAAVVHQPEGSRQPAPLTFATPKDARHSLLRIESVLAPLLPQGVSIQQFASSVYFLMQKTPDLARCTTDSLLESFQKAAQSGLELGATCYILKYGNKATFIADYKGIAQKMIASGCVRAVDARVVRKGDEFTYEYGLDERLSHVVKGDAEREITHAYVILKLPRGEKSFLVMDAGEINAIREKHSHSWKAGPLPGWYAKKTVVRQIAKTIPDPRLLAQLRIIDQADGIDDAEITPIGAQVMIPARVDDDDTPEHGRPGRQFPTDPMSDEEPAAREYQLREPAPGPDLYGDAPTAAADDLEARRQGLRAQIADAAASLGKQHRESIAFQASKEPDVGALGLILQKTREKAERAQQQGA